MLILSENGNYNPNLDWFNQIPKKFLCVHVKGERTHSSKQCFIEGLWVVQEVENKFQGSLRENTRHSVRNVGRYLLGLQDLNLIGRLERAMVENFLCLKTSITHRIKNSL